MNETNLTPRQTTLLNLINQSAGLSREHLQAKIAPEYPISKPTLIRDLSTLIAKNLITVQGKGKNTKYFSSQSNPLLRYFDLDQYFSIEPDNRSPTKKSFDFNTFNQLSNLFTSIEIEAVNKVRKSFTQETQKLGKDILKRELERFVIELSWKSSKIEGNTYTLLETENLIKDSLEAKGKSRHEAIMILNHKFAFEQILNHQADFKQVTISQINQLHNLITKNLNISPGIRSHAVGITGTVYRPPDNQFQIKQAMEKLTLTLNQNPSVLEKALIAGSMIPYIQPYSDGNKRTGRMLTNALLLAFDYFPLSYRSANEDELKKALILFYEQGSLFHLKKIILDQLIFTYRTYFK
jgi:fido (protein-threonine AMPylation protein)